MIIKYDIVKPVTNRKKPYVDNGFLVVPNSKRNYKYYIEVSRYNPNKGCREYFLLLGVNNFDEQCRKCRVDDYGRLKIIMHNDFKDFVNSEFKDVGNVKITYLESEDGYDTYLIG